MKILHLSQSDIIGGAARAAYRLHTAQLATGLESRMLVRVKRTDECEILGPSTFFDKASNSVRAILGAKFNKLQNNKKIAIQSTNLIPSNWSKIINSGDFDIINIHWVGNEAISITDISKIKKPIIWTMHDMWPFCGSQHYTDEFDSAMWIQGYTKENKSRDGKLIDLDRLIWEKKLKKWKNVKMNIVSPSQWLSDCASKSYLFKNYPIHVIPNPLNMDVYKPLDKNFCRDVLNLPKDKYIILFGAIGGGSDPRKGYDLVLSALNELKKIIDPDSVVCVIFGQSKPVSVLNLPFETHWLGHINDDTTLSIIYNAATVMLVPSKAENLPQTATEAQACGIPVVAFNTTGLKDAVDHMRSGYLADPFDTFDFAKGIKWIIEDDSRLHELSNCARRRALKSWSEDIIVDKYNMLYKEVLNNM